MPEIPVELTPDGRAYIRLGEGEVRDSVSLGEHDEADRIPTLDSLVLHFDFYGPLWCFPPERCPRALRARVGLAPQTPGLRPHLGTRLLPPPRRVRLPRPDRPRLHTAPRRQPPPVHRELTLRTGRCPRGGRVHTTGRGCQCRARVAPARTRPRRRLVEEPHTPLRSDAVAPAIARPSTGCYARGTSSRAVTRGSA